ncbi:hypothetical protein JOM56_014881 [Amanita muscaria]
MNPLSHEAQGNDTLMFKMDLCATLEPEGERYHLTRKSFDWVLGEVKSNIKTFALTVRLDPQLRNRLLLRRTCNKNSCTTRLCGRSPLPWRSGTILIGPRIQPEFAKRVLAHFSELYANIAVCWCDIAVSIETSSIAVLRPSEGPYVTHLVFAHFTCSQPYISCLFTNEPTLLTHFSFIFPDVAPVQPAVTILQPNFSSVLADESIIPSPRSLFSYVNASLMVSPSSPKYFTTDTHAVLAPTCSPTYQWQASLEGGWCGLEDGTSGSLVYRAKLKLSLDERTTTNYCQTRTVARPGCNRNGSYSF